MYKLLFLLLFLSNLIHSQNASNDFSISGNVKVLVKNEYVTPKNVFIVLSPGNQTAVVDSLGNYKLDHLKSGHYIIKELSYNKTPKEYNIELIDKSIEDFNLTIIADCEVNQEIAEIDIKFNKPRLLIIGGIAPVIYKNQEKFQKKYKIEYFDFGCVSPDEECIKLYNKFIFKYLDTKFGQKWRKEVRKDVVGL